MKKSDKQWQKVALPLNKIPVSHLVREREGITVRTRDAIKTKLDAFKMILPEVLIPIIVRATNKKARRFYDEARRANPNQHPRPWHDTNVDEIYGIIAILIFCGAHKQSNENMEEIFQVESRPFCRAVMSLKRAQQLLRFMQFDYQQTRAERLKTDGLAAFPDIWNIFSDELSRPNTLSPNITIDEQFVPTRGRCSFRQYMPWEIWNKIWA